MPDVLTMKEAAAWLRLSERSLYELARSRRLPAAQLGGKWLFPRAQLERWLAAQADYVNIKYGTDIEVRVVSIPNDWRPPVKGDFKKETMESLTDLGRKLGSDPKSWTVWTTTEASGDSRVPSAVSN